MMPVLPSSLKPALQGLILVAAALALVVALAGCAEPAERTDVADRTVQVVATTSMLADLAREIGGDRVAVEGLMGPGVDPHLYRATESDVGRLTGADLVLYNGIHLEGRMGEVLEQIAGRGIAVEAVVEEAVPEDLLIASEAFVGNYDPHVWMDVSLWKAVAEGVADRLADLDPTHADGYQARFRDYASQLDSLDAWVRERVATVPPAQRVLVTAHDAFGYFGRAYGFEVRGLQGLSTATEAGTADVRDLADFVAERRIPAMFVESSVPARSIEAVQAAVRSRGFDVGIGETLYSDALGPQGSGGETYEGMIRHNVNAVVDALGRDS